ncbi:DUF6171 family protein [Paenibacillus soyae]|uniref:DUF6171 family protein n=1 Tax=Paenibacillus soyae TaxID=2969249 RepID=A0A9X2S802_9BACL|nr:DUF6171 family protein [Paenibacillus soyae]MCR2803854.1 DUF6171 family protein [Paenibacillus soyae]
MKSGCKGCSADVNVSEEQIDRMVARLPLQGFECVADDVYRERLATCRDCPSLQYGTTCSHCGCFVRVRAKLAGKDCPRPGGPSWQAAG